MCLTLLIIELLLVAQFVVQRVNPANSLSCCDVSLFQIVSLYFVFSPLLHLLFRGQESGTFFHNFNQFITKQPISFTTLVVVLYFLSFVLTFRFFRSSYWFNFRVCHLWSMQSFFLAFYKSLLVKRIYYTVCILISLYSLALVACDYLIIPTNLHIDILTCNLWKKPSE